MTTLRDYEDLIRNLVNELSDKDENWNWSVHSFGKYCVTINWGYLKYIGERSYFKITFDQATGFEESGEYFIRGIAPNGMMTDGRFCIDNPSKCWQDSYETGIKAVVNSIVNYAHSRY